ncbi:GNAT family N-acetyltransferase [uncultured Ferrimonas sp.]|uniref:GNAT family N-acetyltransferase n=1 Tax=uncultured Ferrimonas sp. TaxID=432640 RepID=UPI002616E9D9|nr:GNAT family N-acetyltransferase [uncultured Ferrimonas sp.]
MSHALPLDQIVITPLQPSHYAGVVRLGNQVHGSGYLTVESLQRLAQKSLKGGINCSFVACLHEQVIGFRLTYANGNWQPDQWCSQAQWPVAAAQVCYFKCNTVAQPYRGRGLGSALLKRSVAAAKRQGARAGLAHVWRQSPGNSAFLYFSRCGGELIADHPNKWLADAGYHCVVCQGPCRCVAAEMLLPFAQPRYQEL